MMRTRLFFHILVLVLVPALASTATARQAEEADSSVVIEPMPDLSTLKFHETPTGLKYAVVHYGDDIFTPGLGQTAVVDYTGWLMDGRMFDSSKLTGKPFTFPVGHGKVIKGWDEGVAMMGKGGTRILVIPPELAYGEHGQPFSKVPIPPNATLVFRIHLIDIR